MVKRILSLFLAVAMLFTVQDIPVQAENVSDGSKREYPANPVSSGSSWDLHTEWSYVYFGSYPQTEITGDKLTEAITGADYDENGDAWVDGIKYRRICWEDLEVQSEDQSSYFGTNKYRYYRWERIKWRVLENEGSKLFVMADKALDCRYYNQKKEFVTWETCTLRNWLDTSFYNTAFSSREQEAIIEQTVENEDNPKYVSGKGGNDTTNKIYLLSITEVQNSKYGFINSDSRKLEASEYGFVMRMGGIHRISCSDDCKGEQCCFWWLRSPGEKYEYKEYEYRRICAAYVKEDGEISYSGQDVYGGNSSVSGQIVPVLHIDINSALWSMTDDGSSGAGGEDWQQILEEAKESSKRELDTYKDLSAYREEQKKELADAIEAGKKAIDEAKSEEEVKSVLESVKAKLDKIKTNEELTEEEQKKQEAAEKLKQSKENGKKELDSYKDLSAYREEQKKELTAAIASGKKAIDVAESEEEVNRVLESVKAEIDKIKTDAKLTEEEQKAEEEKKQEAAEKLLQAKEDSKKELDSYKDLSAYREEQQKELADAIEAGKKAIDAAESKEEVNRVLESVKAEIDKIKTDAKLTEEEQKAEEEKKQEAAEKLLQAKESSKKELDSYKDLSDYREEQKKELTEAIASGKKAIDEAKNEEEVNRVLESVKAEMDKIKTDAKLTEEEQKAEEERKKEEQKREEEKLKQSKEDSKKELDTYKDLSAYRKEQQEELTAAIASGKKAIEAAKNEEEVNRVLESIKAEMDKIKTDAKLTEEEQKAEEERKKEEQKREEEKLKQSKENSKKELDSYKDLSDYRKEQQEELTAAIASGKEAIEAAKNEEEVNRVLESVKAEIDKIKTDAKLTEEEQKAEEEQKREEQKREEERKKEEQKKEEEKLEQSKEDGKKELDNYKDLSDYREEQKKELTEAIEAGKKEIEAAKNEEEVNRVLEYIKAVIDKIKTDMQLILEEQKINGGKQNPDTGNSNPYLNGLQGTSIIGELTAKTKSLSVKWQKAESMTGYQIQYSTSRKFTKKTTKTKTVKDAAKTKQTVSKLKTAKKYYVRIRTYKVVNGGTYYSDWSKIKCVNTLYSRKTSIKGKLVAEEKGFTVKWQKVKFVSGYQVQYSKSKKFTKKTTGIKTVKKDTKTNLTVKNLNGETKYYVRVRTYMTKNKSKFYSAWSGIRQVKTKE